MIGSHDQPSRHVLKADLRQRMQAERAAWSESEYRTLCLRLCDRLARLPEVRTAGVILAFWPIPGRREVDLGPLLRALHARGVVIGLPVVTGDGTLTFRGFDPSLDLETGRFGTLHPPDGDTIPPDAADVVLVPALAADRAGHRLGWGAGYYDRLLAGLAVRTVCPVFSAGLVDSLPSEPHDQRIEVILTERETIRLDTRP